MFRSFVGAMATGLVLVTAAVSCGDSATEPTNAPADHTVVQDGVAHAPGLTDPETNCVECHGADLRGGPNVQPSCFDCHGKKW